MSDQHVPAPRVAPASGRPASRARRLPCPSHVGHPAVRRRRRTRPSRVPVSRRRAGGRRAACSAPRTSRAPIPLRPLGLGDIYDAAFRIIRFNPKATVGSAVLVAAVAMAVPVLITAVLTWTIGITYDQTSSELPSDNDLARPRGGLRLPGRRARSCSSLGLILVTGMVAHVTAAAAVGRRLTLGEAWAATRGRRWRLVGLSALLGPGDARCSSRSTWCLACSSWRSPRWRSSWWSGSSRCRCSSRGCSGSGSASTTCRCRR